MDTWRANYTLSPGTSLASNTSHLLCLGPYHTIAGVLQVVSFILGLPSNMAVAWELLQRQRRAGGQGSSSSSSNIEVFLLNITTINFVYTVSLVLNILRNFNVGLPSTLNDYVMVFYSPSMTGGPSFLAAICLDCYLAVVHPATYMAARGTRKRALLLSALIWAYTVAMVLAIVPLNLRVYNPVCMISCYITLPIIVFCNVSTLRALGLSGPVSSGRMADLNPTKRRAFQIILGILVVMVVYYLPQICLFTFRFIVGLEDHRFWCVEFPVVMMFPTVCNVAVPLLFLYSMGKLAWVTSLPCSISLKMEN